MIENNFETCYSHILFDVYLLKLSPLSLYVLCRLTTLMQETCKGYSNAKAESSNLILPSCGKNRKIRLVDIVAVYGKKNKVQRHHTDNIDTILSRLWFLFVSYGCNRGIISKTKQRKSEAIKL